MDEKNSTYNQPTTEHFSVWLYMRVVCEDGEVTLSRHIWLRFAPFPGLSICFNDDNSDYADIFRVQFIPGNNETADTFWCWCEAFNMLEEYHPEDRRGIHGLVKSFLDNGWEV